MEEKKQGRKDEAKREGRIGDGGCYGLGPFGLGGRLIGGGCDGASSPPPRRFDHSEGVS